MNYYEPYFSKFRPCTCSNWHEIFCLWTSTCSYKNRSLPLLSVYQMSLAKSLTIKVWKRHTNICDVILSAHEKQEWGVFLWLTEIFFTSINILRDFEGSISLTHTVTRKYLTTERLKWSCVDHASYNDCYMHLLKELPKVLFFCIWTRICNFQNLVFLQTLYYQNILQNIDSSDKVFISWFLHFQFSDYKNQRKGTGLVPVTV
jgi:hypothetical protein